MATPDALAAAQLAAFRRRGNLKMLATAIVEGRILRENHARYRARIIAGENFTNGWCDDTPATRAMIVAQEKVRLSLARLAVAGHAVAVGVEDRRFVARVRRFDRARNVRREPRAREVRSVAPRRKSANRATARAPDRPRREPDLEDPPPVPGWHRIGDLVAAELVRLGRWSA